MANFPNSAYNPRTKENQSGVVYDPTKTKKLFAEDITKLDDEIVAIENWLIAQKTSTTIKWSTTTGVAGSMRFDSNYIYICITTNTWKRVGISSWL